MDTPTIGTQIPKVIHYVWVGSARQPKIVTQCIDSWKRYAPEYELRLWNEENSPMDHPYVQEMYRQKKWAFVSDYIRFWVLEREGGIYLDTDMELLKSIDDLLAHGVVLGRSNDGFVACGFVGAVPHHPLMQEVLRFYDTDTSFSIANSSPKVMTRVLEEGSFDDVCVLEPKFLYPCDDGKPCTDAMRRDAYATHHWAESWVPHARLRKFARRMGVMSLIKMVLGKNA